MLQYIAQLREDGYDPEGFPYCPSDKHQDLEQLSTDADIADFIQNQRSAGMGLSVWDWLMGLPAYLFGLLSAKVTGK